jgi:DNA replication protein DnaC
METESHTTSLDPDSCTPLTPQLSYSELQRVIQAKRGELGIDANRPKDRGMDHATKKSMDAVVERFRQHKPSDRQPPTEEELTELNQRKKEDHEREILRSKNRMFDSLIRSAGERYRKSRLETYECRHPGQQNVIDSLKEYAENIDGNIGNGRGLFLYGSCGTGKDALCIALAHHVIGGRREDVIERLSYNAEAGMLSKTSFEIEFLSGMELFGNLRDGMNKPNFSENAFIHQYATPTILILSDPLPPKGALTEYQAASLYRLIDARYRDCKPTWTTINVSSPTEANERLTPQIVDRLRDQAVCIYCTWPSYRKASENVLTK